MIKHIDYFRFYNTFLAILCDEEDHILGYFTIRNGNEFGQVYVNPEYRTKGIVHHIVSLAMDIIESWGFDCIWGVCYGKMKEYYEHLRDHYGLPVEFTETPEDRNDGQYKVVLQFNKIAPDRRAWISR